MSPPARKGPWEYFTRTFEGSQYAAHGRRPAGRARGHRRDRPARRERARRRPRLLLARRARALPRPDAARVLVRRRRRRAPHAPLPRPRDRRRPPRRDRRHLLRARVGERRGDDLLRAPRRRDAPVPGVAPHDRDRRPTTSLVYEETDERFFVSVGRCAQRPGHRAQQRLEAHQRVAAAGPRRPDGAAAGRRAAHRRARVRRRAPRGRRRRRAALRAHQRRRRDELQGRARAGRTHPGGRRGPSSSRTATT